MEQEILEQTQRQIGQSINTFENLLKLAEDTKEIYPSYIEGQIDGFKAGLRELRYLLDIANGVPVLVALEKFKENK